MTTKTSLVLGSLYNARIAAVLKCTALEAAQVEGYMRLNHSTLDGLDARHFALEARSAWRDVQIDPGLALRNAQSFGLVTA